MLILKEDIFVERKIKFDLYLNTERKIILRSTIGTSLIVQWIRIYCQFRGNGFDPWSGKILYAVEQLIPQATTTEPEATEACVSTACALQREEPRRWEAHAL